MQIEKNRSHHGIVYKRFKEQVINYRFRPYEPLQIPQLSERFNVGRTPLREALTRLHSESLVLAAPNRGFFAKILTTEEMNARYEFAFLILQYAISTGLGKRPFACSYSPFALMEYDTRRTGLRCSEECQLFAKLLERIYEEIIELSSNPIMVDNVKSFRAGFKRS